jgi:hypothetical protein
LNIKSGTRGKNDMRGVTLSISYRLFNKDIPVRAQRGNEGILNRAE